MSRLNKERQEKLEPIRMENARREISKLGFDVKIVSDTELNFYYERSLIKYFPYSGWHTGKTIKDGRGLKNY